MAENIPSTTSTGPRCVEERAEIPWCETPLPATVAEPSPAPWCVQDSTYGASLSSAQEVSFFPPALWRSSARKKDDNLQLMGLPLFVLLFNNLSEAISKNGKGFAVTPQDLKRWQPLLEAAERGELSTGTSFSLALYHGVRLGEAEGFLSEAEIGKALGQLLLDSSMFYNSDVPPQASFDCALVLHLVWDGEHWNINVEESRVIVRNQTAGDPWFGTSGGPLHLEEMPGFSLDPDGRINFVHNLTPYTFKIPSPEEAPRALLELFKDWEPWPSKKVIDFYFDFQKAQPAAFEKLSRILRWTLTANLPEMGRFLLEALPLLESNAVPRLVGALYLRLNRRGRSQAPRGLEIFHHLAFLLRKEKNFKENKALTRALPLLERRVLVVDVLGLEAKDLPGLNKAGIVPALVADFSSYFNHRDPYTMDGSSRVRQIERLQIQREGITLTFTGFFELPAAISMSSRGQAENLWQVSLQITGQEIIEGPYSTEVFYRGKSIYFKVPGLLENLAFMMDETGKLYCLHGIEALDQVLREARELNVELDLPEEDLRLPPVIEEEALEELRAMMDDALSGENAPGSEAPRPADPRAEHPAAILETLLDPEAEVDGMLLATTLRNYLTYATTLEGWPGDQEDAEHIATLMETLTQHPDPNIQLSVGEANQIFREALLAVRHWQNAEDSLITLEQIEQLLSLWGEIDPSVNEPLTERENLGKEEDYRTTEEALADLQARQPFLFRSDLPFLVFSHHLNQGITQAWAAKPGRTVSPPSHAFLVIDMLRERERTLRARAGKGHFH